MGKCTAGSARGIVSGCVGEIQQVISDLQKNFDEMDFENADAREEIQELVDNMKRHCQNLISDLNSYHFS